MATKGITKTVDRVVETDFLVEGAGVTGGVVVTNLVVAQIRSLANRNPDSKVIQFAATWARAVAGGLVAMGGTIVARRGSKQLRKLGASIGIGGASQLVVGVLQGTGVIPEQFRDLLPRQNVAGAALQPIGTDGASQSLGGMGLAVGQYPTGAHSDVIQTPLSQFAPF